MISSMTPQPYPLACTSNNVRYLILGWSSDGKPIAVIDGPGGVHGKTSEPAILDGPCRYYLPVTSVVVDGEVSAMVEGAMTVEGTKNNGGLLMYGPND